MYVNVEEYLIKVLLQNILMKSLLYIIFLLKKFKCKILLKTKSTLIFNINFFR